MVEITRLAENFIGKDDRERLEAFGGHSIAHGRATRWHWSETVDGSECFEIFAGGADERRVARVTRDRRADLFRVFESDNRELANGTLEQAMAALEAFLRTRHGEPPDLPA